MPPSDLLLRLGEYDLAEEEEPYGYQERKVQIVASHPQFDQRTFEYDLALLRLVVFCLFLFTGWRWGQRMACLI